MVIETLLSNQAINIDLLDEECRPVLSANFAGLNGQSGNLSAVWDSTPGSQDLADLETVLAAHNPADLSANEIIATVANGAKVEAAAIPNWATWTAGQAEDWLTANITDANTRTALIAMAQMLVALRNQQWPDLQG